MVSEMLAGQLGQNTAVRTENKHETIGSAVDNVSQAIGYLENLLDEIKGTPRDIGAKIGEAPSCFGSLESALTNAPDDINAKADAIRRIANDIRAAIF